MPESALHLSRSDTVQPGLNRLDVGPRLSLRVGQQMRAHVDYRLNVAGNASPGSGAVVTLAGDF